MNPHSGIDDNNKKDRTKVIAAAISMAGIVLAAALLSGLSMVNSYQPAIAQQQNMTAGTNATTTSPTAGGGGATTAGSACAPTQTGGGGQNATTTTNATTMGGGGGTNATAGNASTAATNATTTAGGEGNQTTISSPIQLIEQACMAAQNNDTQGVLMNLNLALNALRGGNMTTAEGGEEVEDEDGEEEGAG